MKNKKRGIRGFCRLSVLMCGGLMGSAMAAEVDHFPSHPLRIIVAFAAGGANDIVTRVIAQKLTETWGQSIVVDNRGGAGGNIGADLAAKANPDGYTLFMTSGSIVTANQHIYRKMTYDPQKDFVPITMVASGPQIVVVPQGFQAKSIKEFISLAKAKPKGLSMGTAGFGTQTHLAAENFMQAAGIDATHVPYKGEGPALTDLLGGQINFVTANLAAAINLVQQGKSSEDTTLKTYVDRLRKQMIIAEADPKRSVTNKTSVITGPLTRIVGWATRRIAPADRGIAG